MKRSLLPAAALLLSAIALSACSAPTPATDAGAPSTSATAVADDSAMATTIEYLDAGLPDLEGATIAYLTECAAANAYCQTRLQGAEDMAAEANAELVVFDANFDPAAQLAQVQDAVQRGFDGYLFSPVASTSGCSDLDVLLETGKPVATINSPMCGNPDYTEGTVGFVGMQTESFFTEHVKNAFASCEGECEAVAVGGFVGSDLFTRWESAIAAASAEYPNVTVVSDQPGNFDPAAALTVVQDAIAANPDVSIVVSSWDDMTRGVEQAITASGKTPGTDVRIYSVGGTTDGVAKVVDGAWSGTSVLLPYEESAYGFVQLARAIETGESTPGFTFLGDAPVVVDGPGSIFITSDNADTFTPEY
ncbi:sugar ABC transporter substrate-binding protein [Microbacterium sp. SLBN-146]|uniref:sugar ABC transporter substrate-binding protein n=1 Tax=Microbacterium sp. SLBN-146 TaxID=2768457 RepID=UPI00116CDABF|nr:sugar ABC transporter substrate-binding protein [Microbacterium sp. SLBN-146]TQJ31489.1 monosaccharide ABC transporter substrate-binding protein (CUT2 family) [Microbacterium sp. SLBN-146]